MKKLGSIVASCAIVGVLLFVYYVDFASIFREHRDLKGMISPQNSISSLMSYYHKMAPKKNLPLIHYGEDAHQVQQVQSNLPKLMVLVVGETARAESFALNGYSKIRIRNFLNKIFWIFPKSAHAVQQLLCRFHVCSLECLVLTTMNN